ncbi:MAG: hypothetical protein FWC69_02515 [Defluviitaleaceae bacterium]|nr:hypothetical protein [Defluviitaleaceae bacterium]
MFRQLYTILSIGLVIFYFLLPILDRTMFLVVTSYTALNIGILSLQHVYIFDIVFYFGILIVFVGMVIVGIAFKDTPLRATLAGLAAAGGFWMMIDALYISEGQITVGIGVWFILGFSIAALAIASIEQRQKVKDINSADNIPTSPYLDSPSPMMHSQPEGHGSTNDDLNNEDVDNSDSGDSSDGGSSD